MAPRQDFFFPFAFSGLDVPGTVANLFGTLKFVFWDECGLFLSLVQRDVDTFSHSEPAARRALDQNMSFTCVSSWKISVACYAVRACQL